jgi:hypothetical protein
MSIIDMQDMQRPIKFLGSYTMSHQDNDKEWGCTSTANNESWFSGGKDDKRVSDKVNKVNTMPNDGQSHQYNDSTPQTRGTRRRKMRDEEKRNAHPALSIRRETQRLKRGYHIIEIFPSPDDATYMILIVTAMLMLDSKTLTSSAIQIPSYR